ncbi:hypothetical protein RHSIM_Rhsim06G0206100 [Rhododendron simsii]|uniref:Uncharacterized protein n=1 Tax=Rhododendron simsii TaxID=118357 RepID=A0A834GPW4_RHOSS|nr:hypothetical protein RHSIM_Rhsim06G0206100 [Rhododendron simsii]
MNITICGPEYTFVFPVVLVYDMCSIWQDFHMTWGYQGHIPEGVMSCFSKCFRKDASPPKHTIDIDEGKCPNMLLI